ncbi:MAG: threonine/serine dehydratase [Gemmatimonadales bacterium]|nr:threonine/serine dehydratase [Gemmatimonadales bacterium]
MPLAADPAAAVTLEDVRAAARLLEGIAVRTPLMNLPALADQAGVPVALKCEQLQPVGAFKIRGAYNAVARVAGAGAAAGVVTQSSGNHGQAVAFAARAFGLRAVVVMPASTPLVKVDGVRRHGGEVIFAGAVRSLEQQQRAEEIAWEEGLTMIPPFDHPDVVAGQGTVGLEILEQQPEVDTVLVPVSGGGLLAGISVALAGIKPSVRLVAVEPAGAAKLSAALAAGEPRTLERAESMADGLLTRSIGSFTFPILRRMVREVVQVTEAEIGEAVRFLHRQAGLRVEPSGAVTTAAILAGRVRLGGPTVAVVSGGNVDPDLFHRLAE